MCLKKSSSIYGGNKSINLDLSDHVCVFAENMTIAVYKIKKESMFYL